MTRTRSLPGPGDVSHTQLVAGLDSTLREQPLVAIPLLFGAGLATSLTPCVYPMIPITAGVLSGLGTRRPARARAVALTLSYVTGLALVYSLLGLLAGLTGTLFGTVSSSPWAYFLTANLLLVFGLAMLDVFTVSAPARWAAWAGRLVGDSPAAAFAMGAASGLVAAPCGAPAFAAVLTFVARSGSAALGFLYLLVFSLGMTALLVAVGLFGGLVTALPRAGRWMVWIKRAGGVLLIGMAEYYLVRMGGVL
ncbi:MAG TPA: cytochrome c biogenesis protein CcdA [Gemmatimonadales bacterium]|jgi:cytochrome c-type biogenesis protein|nr:cytochrome c biogenesis protein CcdA [Gemmatimonadales bacterium]